MNLNNAHGILLLDKPYGISSNAALQRSRKIFSGAKAGHGGTLDLRATGMLPILFGHATRFAQGCLEGDKIYQATVAIGSSTTTADREGEVYQSVVAELDEQDIQNVIQRFSGRCYQQMPPQYSAIKIDGKPAYKRARAGETTSLQPREVTIHSLVIKEIKIENQHTYIDLVCRCSKGTYIRSLAVDIGKSLGYPAHLSRLHRIGCGIWHDGMISLDELADSANLEQHLIGLEQIFAESNRLDIEINLGRRLMQGQKVRLSLDYEVKAKQGIVAVFVAARFIGLCCLSEDNLLTPDTLLPQDWLESFL